MASWTEALGYAATGTVVGLIAKAALDFIGGERAHTLELRRRFFDKKLENSLAALSTAKTATSLLRGQCALVRRVVEGGVHPQIFESASHGIQEALDRLDCQFHLLTLLDQAIQPARESAKPVAVLAAGAASPSGPCPY